MNNIHDFKSLDHLNAEEQVSEFIKWAKDTLHKATLNNPEYGGFDWDMKSWHSVGFEGCSFTAYKSKRNTKNSKQKYMQSPFIDFAKSLVVYKKIFQRQTSSSAKEWVTAARFVEAALLEVTGSININLISPKVCDYACSSLKEHYSKDRSSHAISKALERIVGLIIEKKLVTKPFRWSSPLKPKPKDTLKKQRENKEKKLPSSESLQALGEIFNNRLTSPLDIITVSACALLLSQPSRIGELAFIQHDPIIYTDDSNRMSLRWYSEKGFGATTKLVIEKMEPVVKRAIELLLPVTNEAREYAAWLEDHPDEFPSHEGVPNKGPDEPLTYEEICNSLKISLYKKSSARASFKDRFIYKFANKKSLSHAAKSVLEEIMNGWDKSSGTRVYVNGKIHHYEFNDTPITLRKLNILIRAKYLPNHFPYTTPAAAGVKRIKFRDALFTVRTGSLVDETKDTRMYCNNFGVEIGPSNNRMQGQLGGIKNIQSIFERHGYGRLKVNTHAFRHELNTEMHRANLSQLVIDIFSGRTSRGHVYNHETIEERSNAVSELHPKTKQKSLDRRLDIIKTNKPIQLSDVMDLEEGVQDRIIHQTHLGICVHSFSTEPCPKMGSCLTCAKLGCVKGDDVKLANLKEERAYLKKRYDNALAADSKKEFGAAEWVKKVSKDLLKCDALIKLLEDPELENGAIVWNAGDGWTLTNNAAVMTGLVDAKSIEEKNESELLPLSDISTILNEIDTNDGTSN